MCVLMYMMYTSAIHQHFDVYIDLMYSPALMYTTMNAARNRVITSVRSPEKHSRPAPSSSPELALDQAPRARPKARPSRAAILRERLAPAGRAPAGRRDGGSHRSQSRCLLVASTGYRHASWSARAVTCWLSDPGREVMLEPGSQIFFDERERDGTVYTLQLSSRRTWRWSRSRPAGRLRWGRRRQRWASRRSSWRCRSCCRRSCTKRWPYRRHRASKSRLGGAPRREAALIHHAV